MPAERNVGERVAAIETHVQNLRDQLAGLEADQKETVREFRAALERHQDLHTSKSKEAADTKWKWVSAILGALAVVGPIATYAATELLK
jgi:predicted phage gp36 major capsid-like protein